MVLLRSDAEDELPERRSRVVARSASLLARAVPVWKGEWNRFLCLTVLLFLVKLNYDLVETLGFSKFLEEIGVQGLPLLYLALAFVTMVVIGSMTVVVTRVSRRALMVSNYLVFAVAFLVLRLWLQISPLTAVGYAALYLFVTVYQDAMNFTFLLLAGDYLDARQTKRLLPMITSAGIVGGITGSFAAAWSVKLFALLGWRAEDLLIVAAGLLLVKLPVFLRLYTTEATVDDPSGKRADRPEAGRSIGGARRGGTLGMLRAFAVGSMMVGVLAVCIDMAFASAIKTSFEGDSLQTFYGYFKAWFKIASVFIQFFVAGALLRRFGIAASLLLSPLVYFSIFATFMVRFDVLTTTVAKVVSKLTRTNLDKPANKAFFSLFARLDRDRLQAFNKGVSKPTGEVLGALALIIVFVLWPPIDGNLSDSARTAVCGLGLAAASIYLCGALILRWRFPRDLVELLRREVPAAGLLRAVAQAARSSDLDSRLWREPSRVPAETYAVLLRARLDRGGEDERSHELATAVRSAPVSHRLAVGSLLHTATRARAQPVLEQLLHDPEASVRRAAYRCLARWRDRVGELCWTPVQETDPSNLFWIDFLLGEPSAALANAVDGPAVGEALHALSVHPHLELPPSLLAGAQTSDLDAESVARLRVLSASSLRVRLAGRADLPGTTTIGALGTSFWVEHSSSLEAWWRRADDRWKRELAAHLSRLDDDRLVAWAMDLLCTPVQGLAVMVGEVITDRIADTTLIEGAVQRSLGSVHAFADVVDRLAVADGGPAVRFLASWCREVVQAERRRVLRLLGLLAPSAGLDAVVPVLVPVDDDDDVSSRLRANALELLERVLDHALAKRVVAAFEPDGVGERTGSLGTVVEVALGNPVGAFALVCWEGETGGVLAGEGVDAELVAGLRATATGLLAAGDAKKGATMSVLDRIEALQGMELFRGLPATTMAALAEMTGEASYAAGQCPFRLGDPGDRLILILEGRIVVERPEGSQQLAQLGPGDCLGEMAVLDLEPRSADARCLEPVRSLELSAADFQALLWEEPVIAINATKVLSGRLRRAGDALTGHALKGEPGRR